MSEESIRVTVIEYADRKNLLLSYRDPNTGRLKTKSAGTADRKTAEKAAAVFEAELRDGRYSSPSRTTWKEFCERYEAEVLSGLASGTLSRTTTVFDMVERLLNPQRVRDVTAQRISWLAAELRKESKVGKKTKPGLAESSIKSYFAHLKAALRWAERVGLIVKAPTFPKLQRATGGDSAKGRALSGEEFDRILAAVPKVIGEAHAAGWQHYLRGLWLSGFRVGESLRLSWDEGAGIVVDLHGRNPVAHIQAASQKSHRTETIPLAPEFGAMLAETPPEHRSGFVFHPLNSGGRRTTRGSAVRTISAIGRAAGVKIKTNAKSGKTKCATAHDLRRSFGTRWATRLMPADLQVLMRHANIQTTMAFYVTRNALTTGDVLREAFNKSQIFNNPINTGTTAQEKALTA